MHGLGPMSGARSDCRWRVGWETSASFERVPITVDGGHSSHHTFWATGRWLPRHESPDTKVLLLAISGPEAAHGVDA